MSIFGVFTIEGFVKHEQLPESFLSSGLYHEIVVPRVLAGSVTSKVCELSPDDTGLIKLLFCLYKHDQENHIAYFRFLR